MKLIKHELGFIEADPKPSSQELEAFYRDNYFGPGAGDSQYAHAYTNDELELKRIVASETVKLLGENPGHVLEIGYGEGFFLDAFRQAGWKVSGVDFTNQGLKHFFPYLVDQLATGNSYAFLDEQISASNKYDAIICNNVLEHVTDPLGLLSRLKNICHDETVLRLSVPNDGSWLQHLTVEKGYATNNFWVFYPEHLSYFDTPSLKRTLSWAGFDIIELLADFPVDIFLLNPDSNYRKEATKGRNCHFARVAFELGLAKHDLSKYREFQRSCAQVGLGRNLQAFVRLTRKTNT